MNRWRVVVVGPSGEPDEVEVGDVGDLARTVGAAVTTGALCVTIGTTRAMPLVLFRTGVFLTMRPGCPMFGCDWSTSVTNLVDSPVYGDATDALSLVLGLVEHLQEEHGALLPGADAPTATPQATVSFDAYKELIDAAEAVLRPQLVRDDQIADRDRLRAAVAVVRGEGR